MLGFVGEIAGLGISGFLSATLAVVSTRIGLGTRFSVGVGVSLGDTGLGFADSTAAGFGGATAVLVGAGVVATTEIGVLGAEDGRLSGV